MTDEKRVRLSPEARREQLIQIGVSMLSTSPLDELSIGAIAREAGISRGLLFHYFDSKQDFKLAIARRVAEDLRNSIAAPAEGTLVERLQIALCRYVDYVTEHSALYISMLRGASAGDGQMRDLSKRIRQQIVDVLLARCAEAGLKTAPYAEIGAYAWIALNEELVIQWLRAPVIAHDELIELMIAPLPGLIGITTPESPGPQNRSCV